MPILKAYNFDGIGIDTAFVTGGSVTYGSIWGSHLPIIKKYADNGRLRWHNILATEKRTT